MEKIISYITKNIITVAGITILTGTTLTTSALGVMKVASNFEKTKLEVPEVNEVQASSSPSPVPSNSNQQRSSGAIPLPRSTTVQTTASSISPTTPPSTPSSQASSTVECAITLFGKQYDVTNLRNTHSGGNVFNCGTDMSAAYQGRHGTSLSRMQPYLISSSGGTTSSTTTTASGGNPTTTSGSTSVSSSSTEVRKVEEQKNENDRRDEDHEEEEREKENDRHDDEEEREHLESFFDSLLQLVVS